MMMMIVTMIIKIVMKKMRAWVQYPNSQVSDDKEYLHGGPSYPDIRWHHHHRHHSLFDQFMPDDEKR